MTVLAIGIAALLLLVLALFLLRKGRRKAEERRKAKHRCKAEEQRKAEQRRKAEQQRQAEQARQAKERREAEEQRSKERRKEMVSAIMRDDKVLAGELCSLAGLDENAQATAENIEKIVTSLPEGTLQLFHVASTQQEIDFDLEIVHGLKPCFYPTNKIEPVPMTELHQLSEIVPEQFMLDDDEFIRSLVMDELLVMQPYEQHTERKTLHVLIDVSGSMEGVMGNGKRRHDWSRGVAVSLLLKAVKGEATYLMRSFNDRPGALITVSTPEEARQAINKISTMGYGNGTNILHALKQAVADVRKAKSTADMTDMADILLITDGEDGGLQSNNVKKLLGEDIRLNVACIGLKSSTLRAVAASYQEFI